MNAHETARRLMAEAFGCSPEEIADDARLGHQPGWDSMSHMRLVLALEERLGRELAPEEVVSIRSLDAAARLLA